MTVATTIHTKHHITQSGNPFSGAMMLDDAGNGALTISDLAGQQLTIDVRHLDALSSLIAECGHAHALMKMRADDIDAVLGLGESDADPTPGTIGHAHRHATDPDDVF